jgi:hypothetical protein
VISGPEFRSPEPLENGPVAPEQSQQDKDPVATGIQVEAPVQRLGIELVPKFVPKHRRHPQPKG